MKLVTSLLAGMIALAIGLAGMAATWFMMGGFQSSTGFSALMFLYLLAVLAVAIGMAVMSTRLPARLQPQTATSFGFGSVLLGLVGSALLATVLAAGLGILTLVVFSLLNR